MHLYYKLNFTFVIPRENDSNDLQRFEALLALTNILSCGSHEQDKFVHEKGLSTVHYLVFSDNLSIRQASVETLCNVSSHQSMGKVTQQLFLAYACMK